MLGTNAIAEKRKKVCFENKSGTTCIEKEIEVDANASGVTAPAFHADPTAAIPAEHMQNTAKPPAAATTKRQHSGRKRSSDGGKHEPQDQNRIIDTKHHSRLTWCLDSFCYLFVCVYCRAHDGFRDCKRIATARLLLLLKDQES